MNAPSRYLAAIDEHGELPFPVRLSILRSLDRKAREVLAYRCAKHVEPIWVTSFPTDTDPFDLLDNYFERSRTTGLDFGAEITPLDDLENFLGEKGDSPDECFPALCAGHAAWAACHVLCHDESLENDTPEEEGDLDDCGPAFYAACAFSGGMYWRSDFPGDRLKRREFWTWYLAQLGD
ncbi:Imm5 family immunity protein [Bremerella sp. JC817]|uniref:Imm5 family immunity protein n=1 Tax=Bremerella sp. JC817 TaxID=3231756 RepID=UPI00345AAC48